MGERLRSFWGWGWADRFESAAVRGRTGQMVSALLGVPAFEPRPAPTLDDISLPAPRIALPDALASPESASKHARASHTYGRSYPDIARGFRGDFSAAPDAVAWPETEDDVAALLSWCSAEKVAAIPFGGGTSVVGGVEAQLPKGYRGAVSIDLTRMDRVLSIDKTSLLARIQAGATGPGLEAQLAVSGLTLRHFPQSFEFSTLGGWVATRAGGHFATVYTHIDDLVASLRAVTPAGEVSTLTLPGSGAGPDPNRLWLGSEGALGIITEATVRVRPRPNWRAKASVRFEGWDKAVEAVRKIAQSGLYPSNCRLLDSREAMIHGVASGAHHVLLLGFESPESPRDVWMDQALAICRGLDGQIDGPKITAGNGEQREGHGAAWRRAFIDAPYLVNTMVSLGVIADTFETACTWASFEAMHKDIVRSVKAVMKETCGAGLISCRFTHVYPDGPAPYYTFLAPGRPDELVEQWSAIKAAASEALVRHGATITHHHAVGRVHRPWYLQQSSPRFIDALRGARAALDPAGILNPGVLFE